MRGGAMVESIVYGTARQNFEARDRVGWKKEGKKGKGKGKGEP